MPVPVLPNEGQQMPPKPRALTPAEEAEVNRARKEINKMSGKVAKGPDGKPVLGPDGKPVRYSTHMDEAALAGQVAGPPPGAQAGPAAQGGGKKGKKGNTGADGDKKGGGKGGKRPIAEQASMKWANDVLGGNFESNPWIQNLMDPEALDVRNNENLQAVADSIQGELQEDWLGNLRQLDSATESRGRGGSPLAAALRARETEETQEAAANSINQLYAGAYENERNRQMQGLGMSLQAQAQAAGIPISWFEAQTGRQGVNVQRQLGREANQIDRGRLGLARQQFNFEREMGLANAQQDAVSDYVNLLATIGGMGGTTTTPGQYVPSQSPWASAIMGGVGGWAQGNEYLGDR